MTESRTPAPTASKDRIGTMPTPTVRAFPSSQRAPEKPKLLDQLREALRSRHYSSRTETTYCNWVKRYIFFHNVRHPVEMAEPEINAFLTYLAVKEKISSSMYGAGLRRMECLRLRVQDIDFGRNEITVRDGKGAKDRITMLPESLKGSLQDHLRRVKAIHENDLSDGWGRVQMPNALDRKYPNAPADWRWQWVFPQENRWKNAKTGERGGITRTNHWFKKP